MCQSNVLEREIKHKLGGASRGPEKNLGGYGPPRPPLRIAIAVATLTQKRAMFPAFSSREITLGQMCKIGMHFNIYPTNTRDVWLSVDGATCK